MLVLKLKPDMFMTPLKLTLADFVGDLGQDDTPTWLVRLEDRPGRFATRVRSYKWLETYSFGLLTTPYLKLPMVKSWGKLLAYVWRIKVRLRLAMQLTPCSLAILHRRYASREPGARAIHPAHFPGPAEFAQQINYSTPCWR